MSAIDKALQHIASTAEEAIAAVVEKQLGFSPTGVEECSRFSAFCKSKGVPSCPAKPATVAAYVLNSHVTAIIVPDVILNDLERIEAVHVLGGHSNPVRTGVVEAVLDYVMPEDVKPPASWSKTEQLNFYFLPLWTQIVLIRREKDRERAFTRKMQKLNSAVANVAPDRASGSENKNNSLPHSEPAHVFITPLNDGQTHYGNQ